MDLSAPGLTSVTLLRASSVSKCLRMMWGNCDADSMFFVDERQWRIGCMVKPNSETWLNTTDDIISKVWVRVCLQWSAQISGHSGVTIWQVQVSKEVGNDTARIVARGLVLSLVNCHGIKNLNVLDWRDGIWHRCIMLWEGNLGNTLHL